MSLAFFDSTWTRISKFGYHRQLDSPFVDQVIRVINKDFVHFATNLSNPGLHLINYISYHF